MKSKIKLCELRASGRNNHVVHKPETVREIKRLGNEVIRRLDVLGVTA